MNVWIVNPFDNLPVEGYRPQRYWLMSEAFARAGHAVTFWTQDWSHAKKKRRAVLNAQPSTFNLVFVPVPEYGRNICLKRIWSHWRFAKNWAAAPPAVSLSRSIMNSGTAQISSFLWRYEPVLLREIELLISPQKYTFP